MQERIPKGNASNILNVCNSKVHVAYNQNILFWEEQSKYLNSTQSKYVAEGKAQDTWASTSPQGRGPLGWLMSSSPSPLHRFVSTPLLSHGVGGDSPLRRPLAAPPAAPGAVGVPAGTARHRWGPEPQHAPAQQLRAHRGIQSPLLVFPLGPPLVRACMSRWANWRAVTHGFLDSGQE